LHALTAIPAPYSAGVPPSFKQRPVDLLDVDAAILDGLSRVGDFEELARGSFRIG